MKTMGFNRLNVRFNINLQNSKRHAFVLGVFLAILIILACTVPNKPNDIIDTSVNHLCFKLHYFK